MNDKSNNGTMMGLAFLMGIAFLLFSFVVIVLSVGAIGFAIFALIVVDTKYKITGIVAGVACLFILSPMVAGLGPVPGNDFLTQTVNLAIFLGALAMPAVGFLAAVLVLDFLNHERNLPTSEDALLEWRKRHGFTRGLEDKPDLIASVGFDDTPESPFDVPPQERP